MASPRTTRIATILGKLRRAPSKPRMTNAQRSAIKALVLMQLLAKSKRRSTSRR